MSTTKPHEVVYEPIDSRTLSKKEKIHYLTTFMRKPRLDRRASFSLSNSEDSDSEFELDEPLPEIQQQPPPSPPSRPAPRKSLMPEPPKNRAEAELRKLDEFWSFKPIPRDPSLVCHSPSRATFASQSPPRSSSPSYSSGSEGGQSPRPQRSWWI